MTENLSIGQRIAKERKNRKETIADISTALRIQADYLKAIENDDYSKLPGKAYIAGFIKTYAEYLGLDYKDLLKILRATQDLEEDYHNIPQALYNTKKLQKKMFFIAFLSIFVIVVCMNYYNFVKHEIALRQIVQKTSETETLESFFDETQKTDQGKEDKETKDSESTANILKTMESDDKVVRVKPDWPIADLSNITLHYQKSKPPFARVLLKANTDVWFQIRPLDKKQIYVSRVLPANNYYWVAPWENVVLDVSDASFMEVIIDDKLLGRLGPSSKKIRGVYLDTETLEEYFINGENKHTEEIENY
ncbi:MAG: helix-turn-helix domain-containing protein [Proteobacteria bacterium]|nr:helix-turn-helix domain-containing protein [Pseudomonadota bacterium]